MKRLCSLSLVMLIGSAVFAQKYVPVIKYGTKVSYNVASRASGATATVTLTILSLTDTVKLGWDIPFVGKGTFAIMPKAMQSGTKLLVEEPLPDEVTQLDDNETLVFLSKDTFSSLVNNKTFMLNGYTFNVKPDTSNYKIDDKPADIFYAVTAKGNREIWILNNPDLPLICRSRRAAKALDFYMVAIKND